MTALYYVFVAAAVGILAISAPIGITATTDLRAQRRAREDRECDETVAQFRRMKVAR